MFGGVCVATLGTFRSLAAPVGLPLRQTTNHASERNPLLLPGSSCSRTARLLALPKGPALPLTCATPTSWPPSGAPGGPPAAPSPPLMAMLRGVLPALLAQPSEAAEASATSRWCVGKEGREGRGGKGGLGRLVWGRVCTNKGWHNASGARRYTGTVAAARWGPALPA